jgi:hypothetical protein
MTVVVTTRPRTAIISERPKDAQLVINKGGPAGPPGPAGPTGPTGPTGATGTANPSGVVAGTYGGSTSVPYFTVAANGIVMFAANANIAAVSGFTAHGNSFIISTSSGDTFYANVQPDSVRLGYDTVGEYIANVTPGTAIYVTIDQTETSNIVIGLNNTTVSSGTYGGSSQIPVFVVDSQGRLTSASNVAVAGVSSFSSSGNAFTISTADGNSFTANIQPNSIRLATDTTGSYVSNVTPGIGLYSTSLGGENNDLIVGLANTAVNIGTYGGATIIPIISIDQQGRITSASNVSVAGVSSFTSSGNSFTIATADGNSFIANIQPNSIRLATDTTGDYVRNVIAGTGVTIVNLGGEGITPTISIGQDVGPTSNVEFHDVVVTGNLNVTGNVVQFNVSVLEVEDNMIYLNANSTVSNPDLGFAGNYNDGTYQHAGLFRDATDGTWKFYHKYLPEPDASPYIDTANSSFTLANVAVNYLIGNVLGTVNTLSNFSTSNLIEGLNLYYTNARVYANVNQIGYSYNTYVNAQLALKSNVVDLTTANVVELTNLYYTNARAYANTLSAIKTGNGIVYNSSTGNITLSATGIASSTYGGTSNTAVFSVDPYGRITSISNVAIAGVNNFTASGNSFTISTASGATFTANIQPNSVRLGPDTTGDYIANLIGGTGVYITNFAGETTTATLAIGQNVDITSNVTFANVSLTGTLNTSNIVGTLTNTTITAGVYQFVFDNSGNVSIPNYINFGSIDCGEY